VLANAACHELLRGDTITATIFFVNAGGFISMFIHGLLRK
jgi:hypothetical protein